MPTDGPRRDFAELERLYDEYVKTFEVDGELPPMMALKLLHTSKVVENARLVAAGEGMDGETARVCAVSALFHDAGRYEQLLRYNTFRDTDSVDHAVLSRDVVVRMGWIAGDPHEDAILSAVLFHNRRDVPDGLDAVTFAASHAVRDADKLDIFRVLEDRVANTDWRHDNVAFWGLSLDRAPNDAVVSAIRESRPVDYQNIVSLADFVLVQVGWLKCGLHFATACRLAEERGHLEFRRKFLLDVASFDVSTLF